jgi:hypothetical protein
MDKLKILFHVGAGNLDRPNRWGTPGLLFSKLATVLEGLGHDCFFLCHPDAVRPDTFHKKIVSKTAMRVPNFNPDVVFTWNGISEGDRQMVLLYGREKFIFAELGFFNHYSTCYFDTSGTNYLSMNTVEPISTDGVDYSIVERLKAKFQKPRKLNEKYIFVPLQDETDTQIKYLSPFKRMSELLQYVIDLYTYDPDIKIVYKQHPMARSAVPRHPKLVEVADDVHHYIPYAEKVIGVNSNVLLETFLYHDNILALGLGMATRRFGSEKERQAFIVNCLNKQIPQDKLGSPKAIKDSWLYKVALRSKCK